MLRCCFLLLFLATLSTAITAQSAFQPDYMAANERYERAATEAIDAAGNNYHHPYVNNILERVEGFMDQAANVWAQLRGRKGSSRLTSTQRPRRSHNLRDNLTAREGEMVASNHAPSDSLAAADQ